MDAAVALFEQLAADPTRATLRARRAAYDADVAEPLRALLDELGGTWRVYRPWGDARFGGPEIKDFAGAVREDDDGLGAFVKVDARGLFVATGMPMLARDQLAAYRAALAEPGAAGALVAAVEHERAAGRLVTPGRYEPLKRQPAGVPVLDGLAAELVRWKGVELPHRLGLLPWAEAPARAAAALTAPAAVHAWLRAHVGPSALSPAERFGGRRS